MNTNTNHTAEQFCQPKGLSFFLKKPVYDIKELVADIPFCRTSIYKSVKNKDLRSVKVGSKVVFYADDILSWLEKLRDENTVSNY